MLFQDLSYSLRQLVKNFGPTLVVVATLALGIGVNTAVFSIVNFMMLRPLPVPHADRLIVLGQQPENSAFASNFSFPDFLDYQKQAEKSAELAAYQFTLVGLGVGGKSERAVVTYATGNFFTMLGVKPALGRLFLPDEGRTPGADPIIVLGNAYWKKRFNGNPEVIGRSMLVNGHSVTIVGVAPKEFHGIYALVETDAYLPLSLVVTQKDSAQLWTDRSDRDVTLVGRLRPGVDLAEVQASLNVEAARLAQEHPETNKGITIRVFPERLARPEPDPSGSSSIVATLFLVLAGLVLLVACVNVTNILLVRASARQQEMAIRTALGAGRGRLVRLLLVECTLLSLLGGVAGVVLGQVGGALLGSIRLHIDIPIRLDFGFDWRVFVYGFAAALLTTVIVGIMPALRASRSGVDLTLLQGGQKLSSSRGRRRFHNSLVLAQVAGSVVLLVVGGLFLRSLDKAQQMSLGFDPDHVLNVSMDVREAGYDETRGREFFKELKTRAGSLPGVQSVSLSFSVPFGYYRQSAKVFVESRSLEPGEQPPEFSYNVVDPGYFHTLGIPITRGRAFADTDNEAAPRVALVNETLVRRFWPDQDPIGKRFRLESSSGPLITVIGVSKDGNYISPLEKVHPYIFLPLAQRYLPVRTLQLRTAVAPEALRTAVVQQIHALEPNLPIFDVETMPRALEGINGFFLFQIGAGFAGGLGILGLLLAVIGVYGVASYAAAQRRSEMGIRLALGAQPRDLRRIVLKQGLFLVSGGVLAGLLMAVAITSLMSSLLVGVSISDPLTLACVALLTLTVGLAACYVPARRAISVDPALLLHHQ
jgi:predicted permease